MVAEHDAGTNGQAKTRPVEIFYSYAHEDEGLCNELENHLAMLRQNGLIVSWHDRKIVPGADWAREIDNHLNSADIILLLISADFLASDYRSGTEMQRAMERHEAGEAVIIPIILRACDWKTGQFAKLQAQPSNGIAVTSWTNRDEAFTDIAQGLRKKIEDLPKHPYTTVSTLRRPPHNPYFTGREKELGELQNVLNSERIVPLAGLGGIGKTQIAIEYAYRHHNEYSHIFWLPAGTRQELLSNYATIADVVGLTNAGQRQDQKIDVARRWLEHNGDWLLIFDNANDTSFDAPFIKDYLPDNNKGHVILTTRAQSFGSFDNIIEVEKMPINDGVRFLLRRSRFLSKGTPIEQVPRPERDRALEIVRELDCLPLAIEQAASYINRTSCGLHGCLEAYHEQRSALLEYNPPKPNYDKTVATTWTGDFQNIEAANRSAADLLRLCTFLIPDAIPEEIVKGGVSEFDPPLKLLSDPLKFNEAIGELRKYSLIIRDSNKHTLSIHQLVQVVLLNRLPARQHRRWAKLAIRAINKVFPNGYYSTWPKCERLLAQAQFCATHLKKYKFASIEATRLLDKIETYLKNQSQYSQAQSLYQHALTITKQVRGLEYLDTPVADNNLAFPYYLQGQYEQAESLYREALQIFERVHDGDDHPDTANILNNLANLYSDQGKYKDAESLYREALQIFERVHDGDDHPDTADILNNLANLYSDQGKYKDAESYYREALQIFERVHDGDDHPDTADILNNLANLYSDQGKYKDAESYYELAKASYKDSASNEPEQHEPEPDSNAPPVVGYNPDYVPAYPAGIDMLNNFANLYSEQGQYEQAESYYERALAFYEDFASDGPEQREPEAAPDAPPVVRHSPSNNFPDNPAIATILHDRGKHYQRQGRFEDAERDYQQALGMQERTLGEHPETALTLSDIAGLYKQQGRYAEAESFYQRAIAMHKKVFGPKHRTVAIDLEGYTDLLRKMGHVDEVEKVEEQRARRRQRR